MKLLTCGDLSWFMLLPFVLAVGLFSNYVVLYFLFDYDFRAQLFIFAGINSLSKMSMGILEIILLVITKKRRQSIKSREFNALIDEPVKEGEEENRDSNEENFHDFKKKNNTSRWYLIMIVVICATFHYFFYLSNTTFRFINAYHNKEGSNGVSTKYYGISIIIFQIAILTPLNRWIFNTSIYRHHRLALYLVILGCVLYLISLFTDKQLCLDTGMIFFLSGTVINCIQMVLEKSMIENKYLSVYKMLCYEGCVEFILNIFVYFIFATINKGDSIYFLEIPIQNWSECIKLIKKHIIIILLLFFHFLVNFTIELSLMMTLFYLNSNFDYVAEIVSITFIWIMEIITTNFNGNYQVLNIIGYFIILLGAFIYNEIIILYFCGLERNTKKEIRIRAGNLEEEKEIIANKPNRSMNLSMVSLNDSNNSSLTN